jgi:hypothetical protein
VRAAVERALLAAGRDLDLEKPLVEVLVAYGEEVRGRGRRDAAPVVLDQSLEVAPPVETADVPAVDVRRKVPAGEDLRDTALPAELLDQRGEQIEEGSPKKARAAPRSDMTLTNTWPPGLVTPRISPSAVLASSRT